MKDPTPGSNTIPFMKPLPITLQSFTAKQIDNSIFLAWKTANESNFSHFVVEKSLNSKEFGSINKVLGTKARVYNIIVTVPELGSNYYRLKMVDLDGTQKLSNIISVNFVNNAEFIAVENPASNGKFIVFTNLSEAKFKLVNTLGTAIEINTIKENNNKYVIQPQKANPGMYYLLIDSSFGVKFQRLNH